MPRPYHVELLIISGELLLMHEECSDHDKLSSHCINRVLGHTLALLGCPLGYIDDLS